MEGAERGGAQRVRPRTRIAVRSRERRKRKHKGVHKPFFIRGAYAFGRNRYRKLEVEVLRLLNLVGADMGEQVNLTRTHDGRLRLEGIVETSQRKAEILNALAPVVTNPALAVSIVTTHEAVKRQVKRSQSEGPDLSVVQLAELAAKSIPVDAELRRYFTGRGMSGDELEANIYRFASRMVGAFEQCASECLGLEAIEREVFARRTAEAYSGSARQMAGDDGRSSARVNTRQCPPAPGTCSDLFSWRVGHRCFSRD